MKQLRKETELTTEHYSCFQGTTWLLIVERVQKTFLSAHRSFLAAEDLKAYFTKKLFLLNGRKIVEIKDFFQIFMLFKALNLKQNQNNSNIFNDI
jgi:hypothetical protein